MDNLMSPPSRPLPTYTEIISFFRRHLPPSLGGAREVDLYWHTPLDRAYNPSTQLVSSVVLSITPTPGFYVANNKPGLRHPPVAFLHRPWKLDRRALRRGSLVLASHASFDEDLTVGWNVALAERLGLDVEKAICIKGYKENPERKIGLVARLRKAEGMEDLAERIRQEFGGAGELYRLEGSENGRKIEVVAIMNAFHEDEVRRVVEGCRVKGWLESMNTVMIGERECAQSSTEEQSLVEEKRTEGTFDGCPILYLTGAARDYGIEAIKKYRMSAFCVGHRACEEWGISYLAGELKKEWSVLEVVEVLEEEELPPKKVRNQKEEKAASNKLEMSPKHKCISETESYES